MDKNFTHIEDSFKDAFKNWEADFSPSEMKADWSHLSSKIPNIPVQQPVAKPFWGAGKMLGLVSGAAVITTAAVIIYNTYIYDGEKIAEDKNQPLIEQVFTDTENTQQQELINNPAIELDNTSATQENKAFSGTPIYGSNNTGKTYSGTNKNTQADKPYVNVNQDTENNYSIAPNNNNSNGSNVVQGAEQKQNNKLSKKNINFSDSVFCLDKPFGVFYNGVQMPDGGIIEWGDGNMETLDRANQHYYKKPGKYRVRVADGGRTIEKSIIAEEIPKAQFSDYQCDKLFCKFKNSSNKGYSYVWNFGDGSPETRSNHPEHKFTDTGRYNVTLKAYSLAGCIDSFTQQISITNRKKPGTYNVITPNGDGYCDRFNVNIEDEIYFQIKIFDAGGRLVYETRDKNNAWDGSMFNTGNACPEGTYYYVITYRYSLQEPMHDEKGSLTLRR